KTDWNIPSGDLYWKIGVEDRPVVVAEPPDFASGHGIESAGLFVLFSPSRPAKIHCDRAGGDIFVLIPIENSARAAFAQSRFSFGYDAFFVLCLQSWNQADTENHNRNCSFHRPHSRA